MKRPAATTEFAPAGGEAARTGSGPPRCRWGEVAALLAILVVGAVLRFHRIGEHSFWVDELFTVESVNGTSLAGSFALPQDAVLDPAPRPTAMRPLRPWWRLLRPDGYDNHPPLFYGFTRVWVWLAGYTEVGFRSEAAVWSLCAAALLHGVVRWRAGVAAGLWSAAMMALAAPQLQLAQSARGYPMLLALGLAALLLLTLLEKRGSTRGRRLALAAALLAALLTHYAAIGLVGAIVAYAVFCLRGRERRAVLRACAAAGVAFALLWGPGLWWQSRVQGFRDPLYFHDPSPDHLAMTLKRFALLPAEYLSEPPPGSEGLAAAGGVLLLSVSLLLALRLRRRDEALWLLCFTGAVLPVAAADLLRHTMRLEMIWYTIGASPAIYALLATVTARMRPILRHGLPIAGLFSCAIAVPMAYSHAGRPDWRRVGAAVAAMARPGDLVLVVPTATDDPAHPRLLATCATHYAQPLPGPLMVLSGPVTPQARRNVAAWRGIVVVTDSVEGDGLFDSIQPTALRYFPGVADVYRLEQSKP